jgi:hypothetical protein
MDKIVSAGSLVGLVAAVIMTLVMAPLRHGLGMAMPAELVSDRLAPTLSIWKGVPMRHLLHAAHPRQGALGLGLMELRLATPTSSGIQAGRTCHRWHRRAANA